MQYGPIIQGETFKETFLLKEQITSEPTIGSLQEDFLLCEADFLRIKGGKPAIISWAQSIFLTTIGIGLLIIGKFISTKWGYPAKILLGEWIACGAGVLLSIVLYCIGFCLQNERKKVMKKIATHFERSPRKRFVIRKSNDI